VSKKAVEVVLHLYQDRALIEVVWPPLSWYCGWPILYHPILATEPATDKPDAWPCLMMKLMGQTI